MTEDEKAGWKLTYRRKREEIDEEVGSLYRTILDALVHYEPGLPE